MKFDFSNERILAVVAHPDDAELLCAGTLARAKADGATIGICVLCRGDKGQPDLRIEDLAEARSSEMRAAAEVLEAELLEGGFSDGELLDGLTERSKLTDLYRRFRPTLVLAHSVNDYHPDHRAASALAESASWFCASKGHETEFTSMESPPALWWMDTINMHGFLPGFYIDVENFIELKRQMIRCHQSQLARGESADFSPLEELMIRQSEARGAQCGVAAAEAFQIHAAWKRARAW
jgi:LmbE family N-acetylglucosaminyl deacetylase